MKVFKESVFAVLAAAVVAGASSYASAAIPTYTYIGDSGTLEIAANPPGAFPPGVSTLSSPYGTSAITGPVITPLSGGNGWVLTFTPSSDFFAAANNHGGSGETSTMTGKLDFDLTFSSAIKLTANIVEDGIYNTSGNGTVSVSGGSVIAEAVDPVPNEKILNGNLGAGAVFNPVTHGWTAFLQITGFQNAYTTYKLSIDNDLIAESLASSTLGSAMITKKDFSIVITTDGSTGGGGPPIPEPASLGLFAIGVLALLKRRRA
jgi:hypothetical protein